MSRPPVALGSTDSLHPDGNNSPILPVRTPSCYRSIVRRAVAGDLIICWIDCPVPLNRARRAPNALCARYIRRVIAYL